MLDSFQTLETYEGIMNLLVQVFRSLLLYYMMLDCFLTLETYEGIMTLLVADIQKPFEVIKFLSDGTFFLLGKVTFIKMIMMIYVFWCGEIYEIEACLVWCIR